MRPRFPADAITDLYGIEAVSAGCLSGGHEAETWRIEDASHSAWCVKWFRRLRPEDLRSRLELMDGLHGDGFPVPPVRRARSGELAGSLHGRGVTVSGWIGGEAVDALSTETGDAAGRMLAKLHVALRRSAPSGRPTRKSWEVDRPEQAVATCQILRARIEALPAASEVDRRIYQALGERIGALERTTDIRAPMPRLTRQCLHGDYTRPNLLFSEGTLVGVLDLLGPGGYPVWELGRLAFEPRTTAVRPDWPDIALATLAGYRAEMTVPGPDLAAVVRTTLLYNLFSFWGISERYSATGDVITTGNERYWLDRHLVVGLLLDNLPEMEALVASVV